jgi:hypothetical protein
MFPLSVTHQSEMGVARVDLYVLKQMRIKSHVFSVDGVSEAFPTKYRASFTLTLQRVKER